MQKKHYSAVKRTVQILEFLKKHTDEKHTITQAQMLQKLGEGKDGKLGNAAAYAGTIDEILLQINPGSYGKETESDYKIKYKGYEKDLILDKEDLKRARKKMKEEGKDWKVSSASKKAPDITNLQYVHDFTYEELDQLMEAICFSTSLSADEKNNLARKLMGTASDYYSNPFYNKDRKKLQFNPSGIYSRIQTKNDDSQQRHLSNNLKIIQEAINKGKRISFQFNKYDANHKLVPVRDEEYELSVYYIVVYHDLYYAIGGNEKSNRQSHYRIDLMSEITVSNKKMIPMREFENLPMRDMNWDPEQYMSEHLNMAYDEPQEIHMKVKSDSRVYTSLHDWFGNHYQKMSGPDENGYDIVKVKNSPNLIVGWALQYSEMVEILNPDRREVIRNRILDLAEMYELKKESKK